jgi:hypothetical protein
MLIIGRFIHYYRGSVYYIVLVLCNMHMHVCQMLKGFDGFSIILLN